MQGLVVKFELNLNHNPSKVFGFEFSLSVFLSASLDISASAVDYQFGESIKDI